MVRNTSVMGIYPDRTTVSDAISILQKAGYRRTDISVLSADNQGSKDFAVELRTKALECAATGVVAGAMLGAVTAWFISIQTVTVTLSAALVAAGPLVAAFAGAGIGGVAGWIIGWLVGLRRPEYVAKRYEGRIRSGGILLSVHCDTPEWCARAKKALKDSGALNVSSSRESSADYGTADTPTERAPVWDVDRVEPPVQQVVEPVAQTTRK
jgi:hypothetical protein